MTTTGRVRPHTVVADRFKLDLRHELFTSAMETDGEATLARGFLLLIADWEVITGRDRWPTTLAERCNFELLFLPIGVEGVAQRA